jgi:hypothetical protein
MKGRHDPEDAFGDHLELVVDPCSALEIREREPVAAGDRSVMRHDPRIAMSRRL